MPLRYGARQPALFLLNGWSQTDGLRRRCAPCTRRYALRTTRCRLDLYLLGYRDGLGAALARRRPTRPHRCPHRRRACRATPADRRLNCQPSDSNDRRLVPRALGTSTWRTGYKEHDDRRPRRRQRGHLPQSLIPYWNGGPALRPRARAAERRNLDGWNAHYRRLERTRTSPRKVRAGIQLRPTGCLNGLVTFPTGSHAFSGRERAVHRQRQRCVYP